MLQPKMGLLQLQTQTNHSEVILVFHFRQHQSIRQAVSSKDCGDISGKETTPSTIDTHHSLCCRSKVYCFQELRHQCSGIVLHTSRVHTQIHTHKLQPPAQTCFAGAVNNREACIQGWVTFEPEKCGFIVWWSWYLAHTVTQRCKCTILILLDQGRLAAIDRWLPCTVTTIDRFNCTWYYWTWGGWVL